MTDPTSDPMPTVRSILGDPEQLADDRRQRTEQAVADVMHWHGLAPNELKPERVDIAPPGRRHTEEAEHLLGDVREMLEDTSQFISSPRLLVTIASVEATLALAEQQRIANVIAWQALTGESNRGGIRRDLFG